jgi:PKD repeat protein
MKRTILSFVAFYALTLSAQSVYTYSGIQYNDSGKFNGNSTNTLATELYSRPQSMSCDTNNRLYITDEHNVMLCDGATSRNRGGFRGDPTSTLSLGSADGTGLVSRFSTPAGIAVHPMSNDVYVCDRNNNLIRKGLKFVNSSNETSWSTFAGKVSFLGGYADGPIATAQFSTPEDIEISKNGIFYIADFDNHCIRTIVSGIVSTLAGSGWAGSGDKDAKDTLARFDRPNGIGLEGTTGLLVADRNNGKIRRINLSTKAVTTVVSNLDFPVDVLSLNNKIYIAEATCIKVFDGTSVKLFAGNPTKAGYQDGDISVALFRNITHITYRKADQCIYVSDNGNNIIRKIPLILSATSDFDANNTTPIVNQTVKLTANCLNTNSYTWSISPITFTLQGNSKLTDKDIYVSYNSTGSYSVTLLAKNISTTDTKIKTNYINVSTNSTAKPEVDFMASKVTPSVNEIITLYDLTANNATSYKWTINPSTFVFKNGSVDTDRNPTVSFSQLNQKYTVKLDATNANGSGTLTKIDYILTALSANNNIQKYKVLLYPNPAKSQLYLKGLPVNSNVLITDVTGKSIMKSINEDASIDVSNLASGIYFVSAIIQDEYVKIGKVIIEN